MKTSISLKRCGIKSSGNNKNVKDKDNMKIDITKKPSKKELMMHSHFWNLDLTTLLKKLKMYEQ